MAEKPETSPTNPDQNPQGPQGPESPPQPPTPENQPSSGSENLPRIIVEKFGTEAEEQLTESMKRAQRWAADPRGMMTDIQAEAGALPNFDGQSEEVRRAAADRMSRPVQERESFYGFNLAYTLSRWLEEDPTGGIVRRNVDALIASAEAYPDKEINQQLLGELLQSFTTVLRNNEALRETLRAKVESRYKIHNLSLLAKYVDGEKRGPALTAIYPHEAYSLISTDGVYLVLKILEKNDGIYFRTSSLEDENGVDQKRPLVIASQWELITTARRFDAKDPNLNRGGLGYEFDDSGKHAAGFTKTDVEKALGKMYAARKGDQVGVGPSTVALELFPDNKETRETFEELLSKTRVAFDVAEKTAVGIGYAADSAGISLKDSPDKAWSGEVDRQVWKVLLNEVPLYVGSKKLELRSLLRLRANQANGEELDGNERARLAEELPLLSAAIRQNSSLIPMAFTEAKQKVMEQYWDDIDFASASTGDGGREIGIEFWHNVRQELGGSRNVALKGVRRFNDSAAVNLVDAAGFGSMTDLLLGWDDVYTSAVRPMEKRARVNRKLHDMLVGDEPYLFKEIKSLFGDPVAALNAIKKKAIGDDLHAEEADRLMGTYADGVVYANKEMFDQTGSLYQRKNTLDFAYLFANMVKEGVITPKKASALYNKHLGRFRGIFVTLFQSFNFTGALWEAIKQFFGATFSTK